MSLPAQSVQPYLSACLLERLRAHRGEQGQAHADAFEAVFLIFDITGFTALGSRLERAGPGGSEQLWQAITAAFTPLLDACLRAGGDVLYFAGDGLGILFRPVNGEPLAVVTARVVSTARGVVQEAGVRPAPGVELKVRAAVGVGEVTALEMGGVDGKWVLVVDGPAVIDASAADAVNEPGAVTVSPSVWAALDGKCRGRQLPSGQWRVETAPPPLPVAVSVPEFPEDLLAPAERYLPAALVHRMRLGDTWSAEQRTISAIMVSIPGVNLGDTERRTSLQRALVAAQEEMNRVGGTVHSLLGDKGIGLVAILGAPPDAHEDDAARAVEAAIALRAALAGMGLRASIGVATGAVYCGSVGSPHRRAFEYYGPALSLAARLMASSGADGLLVCARSRAGAEHRVEFDAPIPTKVKGIEAPVMASRPAGRRQGRRSTGAQMIGHQAVLGALRERVAALGATGEGGVALVEAEPGMGKSTLLGLVAGEIGARSVRMLSGEGDSVEARTTLFAFRRIVAELLGLYPGIAPSEARRQVRAALEAAAPDQAHLAPLLNGLVRLDFEETALTAQLPAGVRAENLRALLVALFRHATATGPLLLLLEDLHWFDTASWSLLARLHDELPGLLTIGALRPMSEPPSELARLTTGPGRLSHPLQNLSTPETAEVIARTLGVSRVDPALVQAIQARSEGVPFYSQELAYSLQEAGALELSGSEARMRALSTEKPLPGTVTGVLTSRIDRLPVGPQLTLKVAAVLGRTFALAALVAINPLDADAAQSRTLVDELVAAALLVPVDGPPDVFAFRHALTHETAYGLLTPTQRRSLHQAAAERLEAEPDATSRHCARLADHWLVAEDKAKAAHYLAVAGEQSLAVYDSKTAISRLNLALELDEAVRGPLAVDVGRARLHRLLAEAWYSVPDPSQARREYERVFELCGFPTPRFSWRSPLEVFAHIWGRYTRPPEPTAELRARCLEVLATCDNFSAILLWAGDRLGLVHVVFASDNIGRLLGPTSESAVARNMVGYSLILGGLHGIGERDMRGAHALASGLESLHARMVISVFYGLSFTILCRVAEGLPYLEQGWKLSREIGSGLWRHRADFMLGEAHLVSGRYTVAAPYFQSCANIAKEAEPHTLGFATAVWCLCHLRAGADPATLIPVLESPDVGVIQTRKDRGFAIQLCVSIGVQAEVYYRAGRKAEAYALAREEMDVVETGEDTYSYRPGAEAHTETSLVLFALWEESLGGHKDAVAPAAQLRADAARSVKHITKGAGVFPAVKARKHLFRGAFARIDGNAAQARRELTTALDLAEKAAFPWEIVVASVEMARISQGDERRAWLERARSTAAACGLVYEVGPHPTLGLSFPAL